MGTIQILLVPFWRSFNGYFLKMRRFAKWPFFDALKVGFRFGAWPPTHFCGPHLRKTVLSSTTSFFKRRIGQKGLSITQSVSRSVTLFYVFVKYMFVTYVSLSEAYLATLFPCVSLYDSLCLNVRYLSCICMMSLSPWDCQTTRRTDGTSRSIALWVWVFVSSGWVVTVGVYDWYAPDIHSGLD